MGLVELAECFPVPGVRLGVISRVVGHRESVAGGVELEGVVDLGVSERAFQQFGLVVTAEEHSVLGGFGAAVAEWLIDNQVQPRRFLRFGTPDAFFKKSGEQEYARKMLGLTGHHIADKIIHAFN